MRITFSEVIVYISELFKWVTNLDPTIDNISKFVSTVGACGMFVAVIIYLLQVRHTRRERQMVKFVEIQTYWYVGDLNKSRIKAERILRRSDLSAKNLEMLYEMQQPTLTAEDYEAVSDVFRFFYLINSWVEHRFISKQQAYKALSHSYTWWYTVHISSRGKGIETSPEYRHLVKCHE